LVINLLREKLDFLALDDELALQSVLLFKKSNVLQFNLPKVLLPLLVFSFKLLGERSDCPVLGGDGLVEFSHLQVDLPAQLRFPVFQFEYVGVQLLQSPVLLVHDLLVVLDQLMGMHQLVPQSHVFAYCCEIHGFGSCQQLLLVA
jgi:hypothetical protein